MKNLKLKAFCLLFTLFSYIPTSYAGSVPSQARPWLGVTVQDIDENTVLVTGVNERNGVVVYDVSPGSPAAAAGLLPGDVIIKLNGRDIDNLGGFISAIDGSHAGTNLLLRVDRKGRIEDKKVVLGQMPEDVINVFDNGVLRYGYGEAPGCDYAAGKEGFMGMNEEVIPWEKYDKIYSMAVNVLDLTDEQQRKAKVIFNEYQKNTIKYMADVNIAEVELRELASEERVSLDKIKAKINDISAKRAELRFFRFKSMEDFKKILTEEQFKKMKEIMDMGGFGMMGGHAGHRMPGY